MTTPSPLPSAPEAIYARNPLCIAGVEAALGVRAGSVRALTDATDLAAVCAASSATPLVVVLDMRDPLDRRATEALAAAAGARPLLVVADGADTALLRGLFAQAPRGRGCLTPDEALQPGRLAAALVDVRDGGTVISPALMPVMLGRQGDPADPLDTLSPRERDVLARVAAGLTNEGIAADLSVSRSAVEKHLVSIFGKLPLGSAERVNRRVRSALLYARAHPERIADPTPDAIA